MATSACRKFVTSWMTLRHSCASGGLVLHDVAADECLELLQQLPHLLQGEPHSTIFQHVHNQPHAHQTWYCPQHNG